MKPPKKFKYIRYTERKSTMMNSKQYQFNDKKIELTFHTVIIIITLFLL